jgi:hypothetical protein
MEINKEFNHKLHEIGRACGKIAYDILDLHKNIEKILFIVPLRGGWPIWEGVAYGFYKQVGSFESDVVFLPASSIVEERGTFIQESTTHLLLKLYAQKEYKTIIIVDEAISGSSSKMVLDNVKNGVKKYKPEKEWERFYWKKLPIELYLVVANKGEKLDPRIQRRSNVFIYPIEDEIITTDNSEIYPIRYVTELRREISKDGKIYRVVKPDVVFEKNENWERVRREIEKGVDEFFENLSKSLLSTESYPTNQNHDK